VNDLEILEQCTPPTKSLPSWVPDWTNKNHFRLFSGGSTYRATLDRPPYFKFGADDQELTVKRLKIGTLDGLGASYYETSLATTAEDAMSRSTNSVNAYETVEGLRQAVWKTLTGNRTPPGDVAPATYKCLLRCPVVLENQDPLSVISRGRKAFTHLLQQNQDLKVGGDSLGSFFPAKGKADIEGSQDALERIFRFHRSRRLGTTDLGHLGLLPIASRKGDDVFLLLGCNVPMVLKGRGGNKYQVIGGFYIEGYMEGEAERALDEGGCLEMLTLC
jgi:hypothetical protein